MFANEISRVFNEWNVEAKLGKGSYGTVYKVSRNDNNITTYSAVKVIPIPADPSEADSLRSEGLDTEGTKAYFKGITDDVVSEIKLMETFKGVQNIVSVEDYKVVENVEGIGCHIFIRMELLKPLASHYESNGYTEADIIKLGIDICTALELCSQKEIIHRDIKPENIFVNDFGFYKLGDFGVARTMSNSTGGLSQKGTPFYMSPEVFSSVKYDARADIYSLGLVMYKLLNDNCLPFLTKDTISNPIERTASVERRRSGEPLPPPCNASDALKSIILRACAFDPNDRFATAAEMKEALIAAQNGTYIPYYPSDPGKTYAVPHPAPDIEDEIRVTPLPNDRKENKQKKSVVSKLITIFIALILLAGIGIGGFFVFKWYTSPEQRMYRALSSKNYSDALDAYYDYEGDDTDKITASVKESVKTIRNDYKSGTIDQKAAVKALDDLSRMGVSGTDKDIGDAEKYVASLAASKSAYKKAGEADSKKDYVTAMSEYAKVIKDDPNYAEAGKKLKAAKDNYRKASLADADSNMENGEYELATETIAMALTVLPDDEDLLKKLDEIETAELEAEKSEAYLKAEEYAQDENYEKAIEVLEALPQDEETEALIEDYSEKDRAKKKADILLKAENYAEDDNYSSAISIIEDGLEQFPDDEELEAKLTEYTDEKAAQTKKKVLSDAKKKADKKDYAGAYTIVKDALGSGNDTELSDAMKSYKNSVITTAINDASDLSDKNDYIGALRIINAAIDVVGEDSTLKSAAQTYKDAHTKSVLAQVDAYIAENNITAAKELIENVDDEIKDDKDVANKKKELDKYKSTLLNTLSTINGGFTWNDGVPADPFDTSYTEVRNFAIFHEDNHYRNSIYSAEYKINEQYDLLSFTISPYSDFGEKNSSYVQVYVNNTLRYTSPLISQKTQPQDITVDISDATYLKIIVYISDSYSCTMLSNVVLTSSPNNTDTQNSNYTSLSTVEFFNGYIPWDNGYPQNTRGDVYNDVNNYSILHEDNHYRSTTYSAEYFVNKQYNSINFNIAPAVDFGASCSSFLKIYVDDVLVYTSPTITQKTVMFNTGNIDLNNASYMKIVIEIGANSGCVILSDVLLKNK